MNYLYLNYFMIIISLCKILLIVIITNKLIIYKNYDLEIMISLLFGYKMFLIKNYLYYCYFIDIIVLDENFIYLFFHIIYYEGNLYY